MPAFGAENPSVQEPIIKYSQEIGWKYLDPDDALRMRGGETGLILKEIFTKQLMLLNSDFADLETANAIIKKIEVTISPTIKGNLEVWKYLVGETPIFVPEERRDRNIKLIDFEKLDRNEFHVTKEFRFTNGIKANRPDVVYFVNGIPVFVLEAKAPHRLRGSEEGMIQIRRYHEETPELMKIPQSYQIANIIDFFYGPTWNFSSNTTFSWRIEAGHDLEKQVKTFFDRKRILTFIKDYILFATQDDVTKKAVLRPHQSRASEKIEERCLSTKRRGLIWHTQGSGKTYTMLVAAKKIIDRRSVRKPLILMLVDRNELQSQLFQNLDSLGFGSIQTHQTENKKDLRALLSTGGPKLVVSTIQKFEGMPERINDSNEIFVLVDEAHRTTGGKLGNFLMGALPNATYIGFTGTPVSRTSGKNDTFMIFGRDDPEGYLDKYGIKESIKDGTTIPLNYSLAPNKMLVDKETLEKEFLNNANLAGVSDIETLNAILERQVTLRNMMKNEPRMEDVAKFVSTHFKENVEPMGYKAFLVAVDREACGMYKSILDKHLPPSYSRVIISKGPDPSGQLSKYYTSEDEEKIIRNAFRNPDQEPKILIVTEKLLTGFDAPILYCMYLDKPMRDHVLLQAIARINRPYESKTGGKKKSGMILDFVGVFRRLKDALAFDSRDVSDITDVVKDIELLKDDFAQRIKEMKELYFVPLKEEQPDKMVSEILDKFKDETERQTYYMKWREIEDMYDIISPDDFLRPYMDDFKKFAGWYNTVRQWYDNKQRPDIDLSRKIAILVEQYTATSGLKPPKSTYEINENTLDKIREDQKTDRERILSMINSVINEVTKSESAEPFLISIGDRAEKIATLYKQGQESSEVVAKELEKLIHKINEARGEEKGMKMTPDMFSLYWFLKESNIPDPEKIATEMSVVLGKYSSWRTNPRQEMDIRLQLNKVMAEHADVSTVEVASRNAEIAKEIIDRLRGASNGK